jgi:uncharacterized coiled-coil DUF342 family protein
MQINKIDSQTTNFKSKFVPNSILKKTIDNEAKESNRFFLKSIKAIMNDGKDDVLELQRRTPRHLDLYVNGEIAEEGHIFLNYYGSVGGDLINKYASKFADNVKYTDKYNNLTPKEKKLVAEEVDVIKMLSESFDSVGNYIEDVQKVIGDIKQKLDNNTKQEFDELKKMIFNQ